MSRLRHSFQAYRRSMQMSSDKVFVFVEGKTDRYFYGKICESVCGQAGVPYRLASADELDQGTTVATKTGGKTVLDNFFVYLRQSTCLADDFQGKKTVVLFFSDKDIDDLLRKQRRSPHVVYTRHYTIENEIFREGDIAEAAAAATSMDIQVVARGLGDQAKWREEVAELWKDWVKLCVFAKKREIRECNYGSSSRVNSPLYGPVDPILLSSVLATLEARSTLSSTDFALKYAKVSKYVDHIYANNQFDTIFSGKWYMNFLVERVKTIAGNRAYDQEALPKRLRSSLTLTIDFQAPWAEHFKSPLREIVQLL